MTHRPRPGDRRERSPLTIKVADAALLRVRQEHTREERRRQATAAALREVGRTLRPVVAQLDTEADQ